MLSIINTHLQHAKDNIIYDASKHGNFEAFQQYLKTILISLIQSDYKEIYIVKIETPDGGGSPKGTIPSNGILFLPNRIIQM